MKRVLSIMNLLGVLLFCGRGAAAATVGIPHASQPGASLDLSLRHEADNAKRLAADWLAARQNPDGSWGSTNLNTVLTPIAWFALHGMGDAVDAIACGRAIVWLDSQPLGPGARFDAGLWRRLLIRHAFADSPERQKREEAICDATRELVSDAPAYSLWLWHEAGHERNLGGSATRYLALAAPDYPMDTRNPETLWFFARLINRYANGVWLRGTDALDWRSDFARALINAQRKGPVGGHWDGDTDDAKLRATAFALLALMEID